MEDNRTLRLDQLIHEDLVGYITKQFGDVSDWTDDSL
jgi:hypothetical protein